MSLRGELWHHCKASILQYTHTYTHVHIHHLFIKTVVPPPCRTSSRQSAESEEGSFTRAFKRRRQSTVLTMMQQLDAVTEEGRVEVCTWMDRVGGGRRKCQNTDLWDSFGIWCEVFLYFLMLKMALEQLKKKKEGEVFLQHRGKGKRSAGEVETKTV